MEIGEEAKETRIVELLVYLTYQRGTRRLFVADRQVFSLTDVEGDLPSSLAHRKMLTRQDVEGVFPYSSTQ